MKVLVVNDDNEHCHVFPHDTPEQQLANYQGILKEWFPRLRDEEQKIAQIVLNATSWEFPERVCPGGPVIEGQNTIHDLIDNCDGPGFDRSGGGRMYIVEISETPYPGKSPWRLLAW